MFERILIAYDESPEAQRALETGLKLAKALSSDVTVATVVEPLPSYYNISAMVAPTLPDELKRAKVERLAKVQSLVTSLAKQHGMEIKTALIEAEEVAGILHVATEQQSDLLVIGLRKHVQSVEWAGTVRRIANEAPCPILAVV